MRKKKSIKCIIIGSIFLVSGIMGCAKEEPRETIRTEITTGMLSDIAVGEAAILNAVRMENDPEIESVNEETRTDEVYEEKSEADQDDANAESSKPAEMTDKDIEKEEKNTVNTAEESGMLAEAKGTIKIGTIGVPYSEILTQVKFLLAKEGWDVQVELYNDCYQMNEAVVDGILDAHLFAHESYIESYNDVSGEALSAVDAVCYEVYGVYSKSNQELTNINTNMRIGIPDDMTRKARALLFMQDMGWITLKENVGITAILDDITENVKNLEFVEYTQDTLLQVLDETDYCIIGADMAIMAGMDAQEDVLKTESKTGSSVKEMAALLIAAENNTQSEKMQALSAVLQSDELNEYVKEQYLGAWEMLP